MDLEKQMKEAGCFRLEITCGPDSGFLVVAIGITPVPPPSKSMFFTQTRAYHRTVTGVNGLNDILADIIKKPFDNLIRL